MKNDISEALVSGHVFRVCRDYVRWRSRGTHPKSGYHRWWSECKWCGFVGQKRRTSKAARDDAFRHHQTAAEVRASYRGYDGEHSINGWVDAKTWKTFLGDMSWWEWT